MVEYIRDQERLGKEVKYEASINGFAEVTNLSQPTLWKYSQPDIKRFPSVELTAKLLNILGLRRIDDIFMFVYVPDKRHDDD